MTFQTITTPELWKLVKDAQSIASGKGPRNLRAELQALAAMVGLLGQAEAERRSIDEMLRKSPTEQPPPEFNYSFEMPGLREGLGIEPKKSD